MMMMQFDCSFCQEFANIIDRDILNNILSLKSCAYSRIADKARTIDMLCEMITWSIRYEIYCPCVQESQ